ncbi:30S ribosomal protein S7 [candidate division WOR-3 bacterium]|nr:30S ribosomal protein S7 [candidate division WOR-3 bacterium]
MSRKRKTYKRTIPPDPNFNSELVSKFVNVVMKKGKKGTAETIVYGALDLVAQKLKIADPIEIFEKAMNNVKPTIEVKPRRIGGATYQIPVDVPSNRRIALAIRWLLGSARARSEKTMKEKLAAELIAASNKEGAAIKKKEDTHKMAEANKAFASYMW